MYWSFYDLIRALQADNKVLPLIVRIFLPSLAESLRSDSAFTGLIRKGSRFQLSVKAKTGALQYIDRQERVKHF